MDSEGGVGGGWGRAVGWLGGSAEAGARGLGGAEGGAAARGAAGAVRGLLGRVKGG